MGIEALKTIVEFYKDSGIDVLTDDIPQDNFAAPTPQAGNTMPSSKQTSFASAAAEQTPVTSPSVTATQSTSEAREEAIRRAINATSLEELKATITEFDGLSLKFTATQIVFADGNPNADIMIIGEAPNADEDRQGKPFVGKVGQLLDKMFSAIGLSRHDSEQKTALYIANLLNWRPPGNRTPTSQEIDISIPFIEKHIALIKPKILVLMGTVSGQALLNTQHGISKIRGKWQKYQPITKELEADFQGLDIQTIALFHPTFLLHQPTKKKEAWEDLQSIRNLLETGKA